MGGSGATTRKASESIVTARWLHEKEVRGRAGVLQYLRATQPWRLRQGAPRNIMILQKSLCVVVGVAALAFTAPALAATERPMQAAIHEGGQLFAATSLGVGGNSCMTCHRGGGRVDGMLPTGKKIPSLIGAAASFPRYNERAGKVITLGMQVNSCITNGLHGMPLSYDGPKMVALISYLTSLSQGKPIDLQGVKR